MRKKTAFQNPEIVVIFLLAGSLMTGIVAAGCCCNSCTLSLSGLSGSCCGVCGCTGSQSLCTFGGSCGSFTPPVYIYAIKPDIVASPVSGNAPLTVQFQDNSGGAGGVTSWAWDFGDGSFGYGMNPVHVYQAPGTYTVKLTASRGQNYGYFEWGASATTQKTTLITVSPGITSQGAGTESSSTVTPEIPGQAQDLGIYTPPPGFGVPDLTKLYTGSVQAQFQSGTNLKSLPRGGIYGY